EDAAYAVSLLKPKIVVPVHYNTFPPIEQDPADFAKLVEGAEVQVLQPGEFVKF
ncbi:MAG: metal-dependent hydrolase, partial [Solibacillus isronensis]